MECSSTADGAWDVVWGGGIHDWELFSLMQRVLRMMARGRPKHYDILEGDVARRSARLEKAPSVDSRSSGCCSTASLPVYR